MTTQKEKMLPHDIDAEEAVLGSLLVDGDAIFRITTFLKAEDFYREKNRWVYAACLNLCERGEAIDQVTLAHELAQRELLEGAGGAAYLSHLVSNVATSVHIEHYANIVHRMSMMRRLISAAAQIEAIGYEAGPDIIEALGRAEDILMRLHRERQPRDFVPIRELLHSYFEEAESPSFEGEAVKSGFHALDDVLGGFRRSDMIVIAARPGLGKTSLALSIARNAAVNQKARVGIFSIEMSREQIVQRLLSSEAGVDAHRLRQGEPSEAEAARLIEATGVLSEAPIYIDDTPVLRVTEMKTKAKQIHLKEGIDILIIDYLQLMRADGKENRVQEVTEISRSIKELARELDIPVIAVSQLSRAPEGRADHRPQLSDLRESGSIEQDADVVIFIWKIREEEWEREHKDEPYPKGITEISIAKHRNGPTDERKLRFIPQTVKFVDYEVERAA